MDFLSADSLPWLQDAQQRLRGALSAGRLPHSLLLISAPGLGAEAIGELDRCPGAVRVGRCTPLRRLRLVPVAARGHAS